MHHRDGDCNPETFLTRNFFFANLMEEVDRRNAIDVAPAQMGKFPQFCVLTIVRIVGS
jgi:hypothetical protein